MAHEEVLVDDTKQPEEIESVPGEEKDLKYYITSLWVPRGGIDIRPAQKNVTVYTMSICV